MGFSYAPRSSSPVGHRARDARPPHVRPGVPQHPRHDGGPAFTLDAAGALQAVAQHSIHHHVSRAFIPLIMAQRSAREFPKNIVLTFLFTFVEGVCPRAGPVPGRSAPRRASSGRRERLTFAAFGALSLYAVFSRRDFSAWGSFFMVGLVVLFVALLLNVFVGSVAGRHCGSPRSASSIFSGLLVFDTWRIVRSGSYGQDDYVFAAVSIYLDLLNMFMFILSLLSGGSRR